MEKCCDYQYLSGFDLLIPIEKSIIASFFSIKKGRLIFGALSNRLYSYRSLINELQKARSIRIPSAKNLSPIYPGGRKKFFRDPYAIDNGYVEFAGAKICQALGTC